MKHFIKTSLTILFGLCTMNTMAQPVADQQSLAAQSTQQLHSTSKGFQQSPTEHKVRINTATAEEIAATLKGVGLIKAQSIVDFRELNGPFTAGEELTQVKGIGPATVEKNLSSIHFE